MLNETAPWNADEERYIIDNVDRIWYSSTPIGRDYLDTFREHGIRVEGFFGNTEVRAFGYAPPDHPDKYHLIEGQYLVLGLDDEEGLKRAGDDLRLLVSAVAAENAAGEIRPHDGTGFFLYETGDRTTITPAGPCPYAENCALRTPTLDNIRRVDRISEKELGGCQIG